MRSMRATSAMTMSRIMRLLNHDLLLFPPTMKTSQQTRDEEEDAIHDSKRKTSLQHRTGLIHIDGESRNTARDIAEIDGVGRAGTDAGARVFADEAQFIDRGDEGADETEIDEGDEEGVGFRAVVGEERCDCPGGAKDGDDEEDEDVGWCEGIVRGVDVHEVG